MALRVLKRVLKSSLVRREAFIGGAWVGAKDGRVFDVLNPSSRETICAVPDMTPGDAVDAIEKAYAVRKNWGGLLAKVELCAWSADRRYTMGML